MNVRCGGKTNPASPEEISSEVDKVLGGGMNNGGGVSGNGTRTQTPGSQNQPTPRRGSPEVGNTEGEQPESTDNGRKINDSELSGSTLSAGEKKELKELIGKMSKNKEYIRGVKDMLSGREPNKPSDELIELSHRLSDLTKNMEPSAIEDIVRLILKLSRKFSNEEIDRFVEMSGVRERSAPSEEKEGYKEKGGYEERRGTAAVASSGEKHRMSPDESASSNSSVAKG